ncbi:phosphatidylinositol 4-kinase B [Pancytospora epiphaga]|nr:phosphatidylinositol 4-kinase B [Pancytospora epiphaga]
MTTQSFQKESVPGNPTEPFTDLPGQISLAGTSPCALVSLMYHNRDPGIHYIICQKLQRIKINHVIPQLIQTMLLCSPHSMPIYSLLVSKAQYSCSFQIQLFISLKSMLGKTDEAKASTCYFLCCDIFNIAKNRLNKNLTTLAINHYIAKKHNNSRKRIIRGLLEEKGGSTFGGNIFIEEIEDKKPICESKSIEKKETISTLTRRNPYIKHIFPYKKRTLFRTSSSMPRRTKLPSFQGLVFSFARAVSCIIDPELFKGVNNILRTFNPKKSFKNLSICGQTPSLFKRSVFYYETLTSLSARLKRQPPGLRQRSLEVEIEFFNLTLTGAFINPFDPSTSIVSIVSENCTTLDSADNVPFLVVAEVLGSHVQPRKDHFQGRLSTQAHKACVLQSHLNAVNDLGDIGDINGIRENILEALELILFKKSGSKGTPAVEIKGLGELRDSEFEIRQNIKKEVKEIKHSLVQAQIEENRNTQPRVTVDEEKKGMKSSKGSWSAIKKRIETNSQYSKYPGWSIVSFIVKSGTGLKQEYLAYQMLTQMKEIFELEQVGCYLRNYQIYLVSETSGLIETVTDALSIHKIKSNSQTLVEYFDSIFKDPIRARRNFLSSLVGYSLASFLLQIKDRHNGNILIDGDGHIIHVDFGFVLGGHPGFYCVENAPFKFSTEYLELVDLGEFKLLFHKGFSALRTHCTKIIRIVEIMEGGGLCPTGTIAALSARFNMAANEREFEEYCRVLVDRSINNMRTTVYDKFQYFSNGYY